MISISSSSSHSFPSMSWFDRIKQVLSNKPQNKKQLVTLLREASLSSLLSAETLGMIEGALQVSEMHVREVMIPRAQMVVLELHAPPERLVEKIVESGHSRFPVIGDNRDDVQGIFLAKDLLDYYAKGNGSQFNMRDVMRPAVFIPESKRLNVLLREFRTSRNHMAIVVDEYSGVAGLVTIEDVIEQIVGEIDDEHDIDDQIFIRQSSRNGLYTVRALTPIEEFNDYFRANFSNEEFDTVSGLLLKAFGHLPKRGESLKLEGFHFEVARADRRRIHLLRVKPSPQPSPNIDK
ncbi:MAG: magnesium/cobalt efflux protein [Candidatus Parabeggiatoa sp. nov. 2]|nr:MAG: magnesium/cobalt efflux protein [Beggiatoa sp. 4572_84]RKZ59302.1 MAG: magnesium/cobalt efflux protein [Gammaproteobacteria bacterium]